jgi:pimeloyl-ACP methyl ester carboxylesterase
MLNEYAFKMSEPALNYVRTDNVDAQPILCLHGLARGWQSFLPLIPTLALRWQVYALDQRGHGKSERANGYFAIDYVPDVVGFLHHEIRRPTVLYGHSLGAMVAAAVAAEAMIDLCPRHHSRRSSLRDDGCTCQKLSARIAGG